MPIIRRHGVPEEAEKPTTENINVLFHRSMLSQVERFQLRYNVASRTAAIRVLIETGLRHQKEAADAV